MIFSELNSGTLEMGIVFSVTVYRYETTTTTTVYHRHNATREFRRSLMLLNGTSNLQTYLLASSALLSKQRRLFVLQTVDKKAQLTCNTLLRERNSYKWSKER